ncbi:MAG: hypothetical protein J3K34DRAFT_393368 [Monoraphidium minutum]|nr:MAG: hypothetical protein J3K34DRAFT_393368 [Monoraphidium minutum]
MTHGGQPVLLAALPRKALLLFLSLSCRTHGRRPKSPAILAPTDRARPAFHLHLNPFRRTNHSSNALFFNPATAFKEQAAHALATRHMSPPVQGRVRHRCCAAPPMNLLQYNSPRALYYYT